MKDLLVSEFLGLKENKFCLKMIDKVIATFHLSSEKIYANTYIYRLSHILSSFAKYFDFEKQKNCLLVQLPTFITLEKYHKKNFNVFKIINSAKDFLGISLSIVKKIVNLYQCVTWLNHRPTTSSIFIFTLKK